MKNLLRLSILANIALCALVFWLMRGKPADAQRSAMVARAANEPADIPAAQTIPARGPEAAPKPFRWSELESTDYRTYITNLRHIGCPEQTVRDIITADVDSVYAQRRAQVEQVAAGDSIARQGIDEQLQQLRGEEAGFLAALLGDAAPSSGGAPKDPRWVVARRNLRPVAPLIFGNMNPSALQLDSTQAAVIDQLRQEFREELGAVDTNDPTYAQRWNRAQRNADDRLRGLLGSKVFLQYQLQAAKSK